MTSEPAAEDNDNPSGSPDAADAEALAAYRDMRARAIELLKVDAEHSVWAQLIAFNWRDATFRLLNEARRHAAAQPNAAIAPLLGEFIDQSYVMGVVTAVGRLTDPPADDPARGVVSLPTVLRMVRDHRALATRERFVCMTASPMIPRRPRRCSGRAFAGWRSGRVISLRTGMRSSTG